MKIGDNEKMFKNGDKVVCVDITTDFGAGLPQYLKLNDIYTVTYVCKNLIQVETGNGYGYHIKRFKLATQYYRKMKINKINKIPVLTPSITGDCKERVVGDIFKYRSVHWVCWPSTHRVSSSTFSR